jgi:scaffold Nfu/NifU family protein/HEAT repeat protein
VAQDEDARRDAGRREIAARGLTPTAVTHLTRDALGRIELDRLAPVKGLLKQFFSDAAWTSRDDDALADLVESGDGWWVHDLDDDLAFAFGWRHGRFRMEPEWADAAGGAAAPAAGPTPILDETFAGAVVPEATPNPRTIRFVTGNIHTGPSRWYDAPASVDDPRVARLFADFDDVANVLVGPDFVAVGLRRPDRWETILADMLRFIETQFTGDTPAAEATVPRAATRSDSSTTRSREAKDTAVERAWRALGTADDSRIMAALSSPETAERQVAARRIADADPDVASAAWAELLTDQSRSVRRATVDAMVDAERDALRPLLERALLDTDAWIRWKALVGLVALGIEPSRDAVEPLAHDTDFRVRLEAARALK